MKKRIGLVTVALLFVVLIAAVVSACNGGTGGGQKYGRGLDVSFLEDLTIDLNGITALGIEKRAVTKNSATASNVAYADETDEKNKLVGETTDESVVEIMLRTKLGETYSQDEMQAQFNKLYVSGDFIYFELVPEDVDLNAPQALYNAYREFNETTRTYGDLIFYISYEYEDENGERQSGSIEMRGENLSEDFDKKSRPSPVTGAFVFSMESGKIYDLSEEGYEVIGKDVVRIGSTICRAYINEDGEYETKEVLNDYTASRVEDLWIDKYGNIFGKSPAGINDIDTESRVYVESGTYPYSVWYVNDGEGQAVQLNSDGTVKWIDENGLRDPQQGDNFVQKKTRLFDHNHFWEGITDGVAKYYNGAGYTFADLHGIIDNSQIHGFLLTPTIMIAFVTQKNGAISLGYSPRYGWEWIADPNAVYAVWYDITDSSKVGIVDGEVMGLNIITDNFLEKYINPMQNTDGDNPDAFVVKTINGETTYEFYWDEEEQTVKIRVQEEIIAKPKEVKKFQPIV